MRRPITVPFVLMSFAIFGSECLAEVNLRVVARLGEERFAGSDGHVVAFSPDGKLVANARYRIGIWEVSSGKQLVEMKGHHSGKRGVSDLAFSNGGKTLISSGGDGAIRVWEVATGKLLREILVPWIWVDENEWVHGWIPLHAMALAPDMKRVAVTAHGGTVHLWNLETSELEWSFEKNFAEKLDPARFALADLKDVKEVWKLSLDSNVSHPRPLFSPDGSTLATVSFDAVKVWDLKSRTLKFTTTTGGNAAYSPDGRSLVTARAEGVTVWDARTGERIGGFTDDVKIFMPLCFSPDGRLITGSDGANGIRVWDFPSGRLLKRLGHDQMPYRIAVSPDGNTLAATVRSSRIRLWDLKAGRLQFDRGHSGRIRVLRFSADGRFLVSGADDASLRVWETERWTPQQSLSQAEMYVSAIEFLPGGDRILVGDQMGTTRRIRFPALDVEESFKHEQGIAGYVIRDQRLFVALDRNPGTIETWDLNGKPRRIASRKQHPTYGMRIADGHEQNLVASGDYDGNVVVWRDDPSEALARFHVDGRIVEAIAFAPSGKRLATIYDSDRGPMILEVRDSIKWTVLTRLNVGGSGITSIDWSPDGTTLAIATMGRPAHIYFVTQNRIESAEFLDMSPTSLCYSPDGKYLAGGAEDGAITIWTFADQK